MQVTDKWHVQSNGVYYSAGDGDIQILKMSVGEADCLTVTVPKKWGNFFKKF